MSPSTARGQLSRGDAFPVVRQRRAREQLHAAASQVVFIRKNHYATVGSFGATGLNPNNGMAGGKQHANEASPACGRSGEDLGEVYFRPEHRTNKNTLCVEGLTVLSEHAQGKAHRTSPVELMRRECSYSFFPEETPSGG